MKPYSLFENLLKFLNEEKMCDVTLVAGDGKKIPAHRLILSTATDYFYALFTTDLKGQSSVEMDINITNIDGATLANVVKCLYTGVIDINVENVEALLAAASFLLFPYLEKKCTEFLDCPGRVNMSNCLGIWALARSYEFQELTNCAFLIVLGNFRELFKCDDFLRLNSTDLTELLENDALLVNSEEDVFNAVVGWVEFDLIKRKAVFSNLVKCVRLHLLSSAFMFGRVLQVYQQFDCADVFLTLNKSFNSNNHKCERSAKNFNGLLAIDCEYKTVESYSHGSKQWTHLGRTSAIISYFGTVLHHGKLIIIGGLMSGCPISTVESIDIVTKTKVSLKPMLERRLGHSTIIHDDHIYAFGGYDNISELRTAERYDFKTDTWEMLPPMSIERQSFAVAILLRKIFVIGGQANGHSSDHNSVESYDPLANSWTSVASMNERRCKSQAGVSAGYLYVVGGCNIYKTLFSIEKYDHQTNTWTTISFQLDVPRHSFGMTIFEDWIIVAGGYPFGKDLKSCEKLNLKTGERENLPSMVVGKGRCQLHWL